MRVHLNIGSNLGDSRETLKQAVAALRRLAHMCLAEPDFRESDVVESEPWGFESPRRFCNQGVSFECTMEPVELLHRVQAIERELCEAIGADTAHRNPDGSYCDRALDIDIIAYGNLCISNPELTLPHPRAGQRAFVTTPLGQIDPDLLTLLR